MTWFEHGLNALKTADEEVRRRTDYKRWLMDADLDIIEDRNAERPIVTQYKLSSTFRNDSLRIHSSLSPDAQIAQYSVDRQGVEFQPTQNGTKKLLSSEAAFREHLIETVGAAMGEILG